MSQLQTVILCLVLWGITVTDDYLALRQNVLENPDADLPRLVLADYLEETGVRQNILTAKFIRDHIEVWYDEKQAAVKKTLVKRLAGWYDCYYNNYQQLSNIGDLQTNLYMGTGKLLHNHYRQALDKTPGNLSNYYKYRCSIARVTRGFVSSVDVADASYSWRNIDNVDKYYKVLATELNTHPLEEIRIRTRHGRWATLNVERGGSGETNQWCLVENKGNWVASMSAVTKRCEVFNELYGYIKRLGWIN